MSKSSLVMGASALVVAALGLGDAASATTVTQIYGGGGSLIAPSLRLGANCFGVSTDLVIRGTAGSGPSGPTYHNPTLQAFAPFKNLPAVDCTPVTGIKPLPKTNVQVNYLSSGSGGGLSSFFSHNAITYWGDTLSTANTPYPDVHFGESDAGLTSADVSYYNTGVQGTSSIVATVPSGGNPALYGNVIQFPLLITPVTLAFDPTYAKNDSTGTEVDYHFNIASANTDGSGGLVIDNTTLCGIVNGAITLWSQIPTSLNGGQSLADAADTDGMGGHPVFDTLPLKITGRSDSSGTTSIYTRALAEQCASYPGNQYTTGATTISAASNAATQALYTLASGSAGVAGVLDFTAVPTSGQTLTHGNLGYIGPDYVWPANQKTLANQFPASSGNAYHLDVVNLVNVKNGTTYEPSPANTLTAFNSVAPQPPQSNSKGAYVASNTANGLRSDPTAWVESPAPSQPLGNPTSGYPMLGTTQADFYQCYAVSPQSALESNVVTFIDSFLLADKRWIGPSGVLQSSGFVPLPTAWTTAIKQTFGAPNTLTKPLNLYISKHGVAGPCLNVAGA